MGHHIDFGAVFDHTFLLLLLLQLVQHVREDQISDLHRQRERLLLSYSITFVYILEAVDYVGDVRLVLLGDLTHYVVVFLLLGKDDVLLELEIFILLLLLVCFLLRGGGCWQGNLGHRE